SVAAGARAAVFRGAMLVAGGFAITLAGRYSWRAVVAGLALLYLPMLAITWKAPEPEETAPAPRTLKAAVWHPFLGFLSRHRALEILAFVLLYKLADNFAQALQRPFLFDMGYSDFDRGVVLGTIGPLATVTAVVLGSSATAVLGLGRALWIFGFLQSFANLGFVLLSLQHGPNRPLMYVSVIFMYLADGLGTGAYSVLLLRM